MKNTSCAAGLLALTLSAPSSFAADSCGGGCPKPPINTRAVSSVFVPLAAFPGNTLSATLAKGTKTRILMADGMLTDGPVPAGPVPRAYALGMSVNGIPMQPHSFGSTEAVEDCGSVRVDPDGFCTVSGQWWLDMDDPANAALLGVPITVTLIGGDLSGGPAVGNFVDISLRVLLQVK